MDIPGDIKAWRKTQRAALLALRSAVPGSQRREWTAIITRLLVEGFPQLQRMTVSFYWPFQGEFDPRFAIREFRQGGAIAALPEVVQKSAPLRFREWWPGVAVKRGVFDLPVPDGTAVIVPQALLIPPVGFDAHGYRLGYGGGYFDRSLAVIGPRALKIGVAFELSRMATIHPQSHDIPMDFIVTEAGIHRVGRTGLERIEPHHAAGFAGKQLMDRANAEENSAADGEAPHEYASPPCYAHEFDDWQISNAGKTGDA